MREMPETKSSVLIALTGWGQMEFKESARSREFNHHLVKPVDLDALESTLNEAMAKLPS